MKTSIRTHFRFKNFYHFVAFYNIFFETRLRNLVNKNNEVRVLALRKLKY